MKRALTTIAAAVALTVWPASSAHAATFGWSWADSPVYVYDATPAGTNWQVSEAVSEWRAGGIDLRMTSDPGAAHITVTQPAEGPPYGGWGYASWWGEGDGVVDGCTVSLSWAIANHATYAENTALHEIGHCIGLDHTSKLTRSVMNREHSKYDHLDKPTSWDLKNVRSLYR